MIYADEDRWQPADTKARLMYHLALKIAHRVLSECLFPRTETPQKIKTDELFLLYCVLYGRPADCTTLLAATMSKLKNKRAGNIGYGGIVTHIARSLGVDFSACTRIRPYL